MCIEGHDREGGGGAIYMYVAKVRSRLDAGDNQSVH